MLKYLAHHLHELDIHCLMPKLYYRPEVVPETINYETSSFNMKLSISTIQDIKETFMLSLLIQQHIIKCVKI